MKRTNFHNLKCVIVDWVDSVTCGGWRGEDEKTDMHCQTIGYLVEKCKDRIIICQSVAACNSRGEHIEIPKVAITSMRYLKI